MDVPEATALSTLSLADRITRLPVAVEGNLILYNSRPHRPLRHQSVGGLQLPASGLL